MKPNDAISLVMRYGILVILSLFNLALIYSVLTPLTVYPVFSILSLVYGSAALNGSEIAVNGEIIRLIPACIAGSAYFLLLTLNLSTPMKPRKRAGSLAFLILLFLALNIIRISVFSGLAFSGYEYFDLTHQAFWYFGSTLLVVLIWFGSVFLFNIKSIPIFTDFKRLFRQIYPKRL